MYSIFSSEQCQQTKDSSLVQFLVDLIAGIDSQLILLTVDGMTNL
jgi:hypothetical protein